MICVDASVAVKWVLQEELSDRARALYRTHARTTDAIVAPALLLFEVTNIIRQRMRRAGAMPLVAASRALDDFLALAWEIELHAPPGLHQLALTLAADHDLPAAYDAHYLALSQLLGCEFWTDDQRLLQQVGDRLPYVRALAQFTSAEP
jgi:predicted nucleic acid-binding protein